MTPDPTIYLRRRGWRVRADELHGGVWIFNGTLSGWQPSVELAARAVAGGWPRMGEWAGESGDGGRVTDFRPQNTLDRKGHDATD